MTRKWIGCVLGLLFCVGAVVSAHGQNVQNYVWINPAYDDVISPEEITSPPYSRRSSRQFTCTSEAAVADYLRQNFQARNTQISFVMDWDFAWGDVDAIYSRARGQSTEGDDYLKFCILGDNRGYRGRDGYAEISLGVSYVATYEEEQQVDRRVDEILATIVDSGMGVEAKEKAIHDWIVANVEYDLSFVERSAYAALFRGATVCQGYALLMHKMLEEVGISSRIVRSEAMSHAWNMVNLCGTWYHVDATWDDPVPDVPGRILYDHFNLSDAEIGSTHFGWKATVPDAPDAPIGYVEGVCDGAVEGIIWLTSKDEAMAQALAEGKEVLLLAGRPICSLTTYMKETVCEMTSPAIRNEILAGYIPWYSDVDASTEWGTYSWGLGSFTLPLICRIDPGNPDQYLDRSTGVQDADAFYDRLRSFEVEKGDVNHRDGVNLQDAILALQAAVGASSDDVFTDADVNGDSRIGIVDAIYILQKVARLRQ